MAVIYTKAGDKGKVKGFRGNAKLKNDIVFEALGTVDELSASLGLSRVSSASLRVREIIEQIQKDLIGLSALLAGSENRSNNIAGRIKQMEEVIDKIKDEIKIESKFILSGENFSSSYLHLSRTICRRAERRIVELAEQDSGANILIPYFNRLSDLLFALALFSSQRISL